jgi:signal transduction histidine kinase
MRVPRRTVRLRLTVLYGALSLLTGVGLLAITTLLAGTWSKSGGISAGRQSGYFVSGSGGARTRAVSGQQAARIRSAQLEISQHVHASDSHQILVGALIALGIMAAVSVLLGWLFAGRMLRPVRAMTGAARRISEDNLDERLAVPGPSDELKDLADTIDGLLERLHDAFAAQRRFVADASHELRTPLTLSRTLLQMALTDPQPTLASYRTTCTDVLTAGEQQEQLIEALLTLARSQRGLDRREPVDLALLTRDVVQAYQADAAGRGLALGASIAAAPVLGDERLLQRLVVNLVENALRYNVPGGRVDVEVAVAGGQPRLRIVNTGPVVPAGQIGRLLEPFQRMSAARTGSDGEGIGLGLSIVAAIARAHRATLTVHPAPDGGLAIGVSFPACAARGR